jgi:tetratricopeptide (TPR) repeat protein
MGSHDWYRNEVWDDAIETQFHQRLHRARRKSQYLRIQASYLARSYPMVALRLLQEYFALGEHFDMAQAHVDRANALKALGDHQGALTSLEAALEREQADPNLRTQAYLDFAFLIADARLEWLYARGIEVLDANKSRPIFPVESYRANGARALLLQALGRGEEARTAACAAVAAAGEVNSGFRYHQKLGLVNDANDEFGARVAALAR